MLLVLVHAEYVLMQNMYSCRICTHAEYGRLDRSFSSNFGRTSTHSSICISLCMYVCIYVHVCPPCLGMLLSVLHSMITLSSCIALLNCVTALLHLPRLHVCMCPCASPSPPPRIYKIFQSGVCCLEMHAKSNFFCYIRTSVLFEKVR